MCQAESAQSALTPIGYFDLSAPASIGERRLTRRAHLRGDKIKPNTARFTDRKRLTIVARAPMDFGAGELRREGATNLQDPIAAFMHRKPLTMRHSRRA